MLELELDSETATLALARSLAEVLEGGDVVGLEGGLGAGKTTFTRAAVHGLGLPEETAVTSPTFVLMHCYRGRLPMVHLDAYRLSGPDDMHSLGCEHLVGGDGVAVIEWADRVAAWLPPGCLEIRITIEAPNARSFRLTSDARAPGGLLDRARAALRP